MHDYFAQQGAGCARVGAAGLTYGIPNAEPRSRNSVAMISAIVGATKRRRRFILHDSLVPPIVTAAIRGTVPTPNAAIKSIAPGSEPVPNAPSNAAVTRPQGKRPFKSPMLK